MGGSRLWHPADGVLGGRGLGIGWGWAGAGGQMRAGGRKMLGLLGGGGRPSGGVIWGTVDLWSCTWLWVD